MPRKEARSKIAKRMADIVAFLTELGGNVTDDNREYYPRDADLWHVELRFNTQLGVWNVNVYDDWIATNFDSGTGYVIATGDKRSYSHKHNFHFNRPLPPTDEVISELGRFANKVLGAKPTQDELAKILQEQNARLIRMHEFAGYRRQDSRSAAQTLTQGT